MEWSRTKSILIIGLLLTNIILGLYLFSSDSLFSKDDVTEDQSLKEVISILEKNNVFISMDSVTYYRIIQDLELEYISYDIGQASEKFLSKDYVINDNMSVSGDEYVKVESDIELVYSLDSESVDRKEIDIEEAKIIADKFIFVKGFGSDDKYFWNVSMEDGNYIITYKQKYNDFYLDDSYMTVTIKGSDVIEFKRKWFNVKNVFENNRRIIPPSKALFKFMDTYSDGLEKIVVTDISFGYKLDTGIMSTNVESGDAFPYWRIRTDSDRIYFIEAVEN